MRMGLQKLPIHLLVHKKWLASEMRVKINEAKVKQYTQEKAKGMIFPPPVVFYGPDEIYRVGDGFHRILAEKANGEDTVAVNLRPGLLKDAILFNLKANREGQGLLFSSGDLTKAIKTLLSMKDFKNLGRTQVAEIVGCTPGLVSRVAIDHLGMRKAPRARLRVIEPNDITERVRRGEKPEEIAEDIGVSVRTVYRRIDSSHWQTCPTCNGKGRILKEIANGKT